jgi:hypothetical protein
MPRNRYGQLISFAIDQDDDQRFAHWITIKIKHGTTVQKVAGERGHPKDARAIADKNGIRSVRSKLSRHTLKVPGNLIAAASFHVLAGDQPPRPVSGYAKFSVLDRSQRVGLTTFDGYDPFSLEVPIRFEAFVDGAGLDIERDIALLERMAGRGSFPGAAVGPPPIIRVSTTNAKGEVVPLIPANYQWSPRNPTGPLWRVAGIEWDEDAKRNAAGNRVRQLAVVTLQQHTRICLLDRSVTARAKARAA